MHIVILIDCDTVNEFYDHCTVIRKTIKKTSLAGKLDPCHDDFPPQHWEDCNCYGTHTVSISPDIGEV